MACFSCGASSNKDELAVLSYFYNEYVSFGTERYFYRTGKGKPLKFVLKSSFNEVYKREIKENLSKGAEYAHISEFGS